MNKQEKVSRAELSLQWEEHKLTPSVREVEICRGVGDIGAGSWMHEQQEVAEGDDGVDVRGRAHELPDDFNHGLGDGKGEGWAGILQPLQADVKQESNHSCVVQLPHIEFLLWVVLSYQHLMSRGERSVPRGQVPRGREERHTSRAEKTSSQTPAWACSHERHASKTSVIRCTLRIRA